MKNQRAAEAAALPTYNHIMTRYTADIARNSRLSHQLHHYSMLRNGDRYGSLFATLFAQMPTKMQKKMLRRYELVALRLQSLNCRMRSVMR